MVCEAAGGHAYVCVCTMISSVLSVLPSYEPSWLTVLGTRRKNQIHSFIHVDASPVCGQYIGRSIVWVLVFAKLKYCISRMAANFVGSFETLGLRTSDSSQSVQESTCMPVRF